MNRNSLKQAGLILIFLAAGMAAGIQAQPGRGGYRGGRGMQHRPMMGEFQQRDSIREQYRLTDEQREKMAKLRKEHQAEMQKLRDEFRKETEKILTPEQLSGKLTNQVIQMRSDNGTGFNHRKALNLRLFLNALSIQIASRPKAGSTVFSPGNEPAAVPGLIASQRPG